MEKTIQLAPSTRKPKPLQEKNNSTHHEKTTQLSSRNETTRLCAACTTFTAESAFLIYCQALGLLSLAPFPRCRTQWLWPQCNVFYVFTSDVTENVRTPPECQSLVVHLSLPQTLGRVDGGEDIPNGEDITNFIFWSPNLEMGSGISRLIWEWEIMNPDQDNGTKLLNYCIVIGPRQVYTNLT
ncbi:hypothetical protein TNCV_2617331 [Trichonephila clavipes]|nr:hypothetical protein TNCV_2617331 [Trichonephila clavipes]